MTAINPHLTPTAYGQIKPGDRVVQWPLNPARVDAHHLAHPVAEIIRTYRTAGFTDLGLHGGAPRYEYYDYEVIVWRDTNGSLFEDRADETVYIAPAVRPTRQDHPMTNDRTVAYRSPDTRTLYCVTCARQESGWQAVTAAEVQDDTVCDFCGGRVLAVASQTLAAVVARYVEPDA